VATRLAKLTAWRAETARARNVPAYVVFHDATLEDMARVAPGTYLALGAIGGVGARKLEAYGEEILQLLAAEE
jgi:ATP-dependent DNA helicase RecQ